eukprot:6683514-Prymnesium_polylepis.1
MPSACGTRGTPRHIVRSVRGASAHRSAATVNSCAPGTGGAAVTNALCRCPAPAGCGGTRIDHRGLVILIAQWPMRCGHPHPLEFYVINERMISSLRPHCVRLATDCLRLGLGSRSPRDRAN